MLLCSLFVGKLAGDMVRSWLTSIGGLFLLLSSLLEGGLPQNEVFQSQVLQPGNNLKLFNNVIPFTALLSIVVCLGMSLSSQVRIQRETDAITYARGSCITRGQWLSKSGPEWHIQHHLGVC